jgi:hypothetical protein
LSPRPTHPTSEVQRFASRCAASVALSQFEALHHKQSYWLAEIETPA